jgi:hypothetical protein
MRLHLVTDQRSTLALLLALLKAPLLPVQNVPVGLDAVVNHHDVPT